MKEEKDLSALIRQIQESKKYRDLNIPVETIRDLLEREIAHYKKSADALQSVRSKLHNILAPYLGDVDYAQAGQDLENTFASGESAAVRRTCETILTQHDSTRERMPYLEDFYRQIFEICGKPAIILDLACGLNPFALPWMHLPASTRYYAYDIHSPRVKLINRFFRLSGMQPLAEVRDILVRPPEIRADAAFLFKEAHRLEKRQKGCNRGLWAALPVRYLFVSLPKRSLDGKRDLRERMRRLVESSMEGHTWESGELDFPGESVYWIRKNE